MLFRLNNASLFQNFSHIKKKKFIYKLKKKNHFILVDTQLLIMENKFQHKQRNKK